MPNAIALGRRRVGRPPDRDLVTAIAGAYAAFVVWRVLTARPAEPSATFAPMSAQTPLPVETAKDG